MEHEVFVPIAMSEVALALAMAEYAGVRRSTSEDVGLFAAAPEL